MFKKSLLSLIFFSCLGCVFAQENYVNGISKAEEKKIDSLFSQWGDRSKPGIIMAILKDNELVYQKSFGSKNIETQQPILKNTKFQVARMSRHFTAFGALLLQSQNKLSLEDDIKKHIPELTNIKGTIRVIDLLNQSDGFYDHNILKVVSGKPFGFKTSNNRVVELLSKQKQLNFEPGTDFVDFTTDSGIVLLTKIIEKVSGKSFNIFMKDEIFDPLGMKNTTFVLSENGALTGVANPYLNSNGKFVSAEMYDNVYGPTNLFTTVEDLIKWELNMVNPKLGNKDLFDLLNSVVTLKNGKKFNVPQGQFTLGQQYGHYERDLYSIYYTGHYGGHASSMFKFPEQGFAAIVLSNNGEAYNGYYGVLSSHILLKDDYKESAIIDVKKLPIKSISKKEVQKFTGDYWDQVGGLYRTISIQNDTLKYVRNNGNGTPLYYLGKNKFQMLTGFDDKIFLTFDFKKKLMFYESGESDPIKFEGFQFVEEKDKEFKEYQGTYYNYLLQVGYDVVFKDKALLLKNVNNEEIKIIRIKGELFNGSEWFLRTIVFERSSTGKILGFKTHMKELEGLYFQKI